MKKHKSKFQPVGNRYCSLCRCSQPTNGGDWIISADKLKRKWHCGKHFQSNTDEIGSLEAQNHGIIDNQPE